MMTSSYTRNYLPVEDLPQSHQILMSTGEQLKVKNELIAARRQAAPKASRDAVSGLSWPIGVEMGQKNSGNSRYDGTRHDGRTYDGARRPHY
jgi:hypothetical protein